MKTALEMAKEWNVNVRTVQKWAKDGKLAQAHKIGRDWMIPDNTKCPLENHENPLLTKSQGGLAMPLMNGTFLPGEALNYISSIKNTEERCIAIAEYYYFCGNTQMSCLHSEQMLLSENDHIRLSALLVHSFSNIEQKNIEAVRKNITKIQEEVQLLSHDSEKEATGMLVRSLIAILLHNTRELPLSLDKFTKFLPDGMKLYAYYALAHLWYLKGDYSRSLGIADTGLSMLNTVYPISLIYLNLIAAMDCMNMKNTVKGKEYFINAWELAKYDGFYQPFGEHHGLLQGLVEVVLKKEHQDAYDKIIKITYQFSDGWRKIHNLETCESVTDLLTTTEFSIAMLASKKWSNKQIAQYMDISEGTVKNHISNIYNKLNIRNRKDLSKYLLI
ncbi:MAG: LuxR C-terminal-related transcriptional regulator [Lachnospiraceae bacterium]